MLLGCGCHFFGFEAVVELLCLGVLAVLFAKGGEELGVVCFEFGLVEVHFFGGKLVVDRELGDVGGRESEEGKGGMGFTVETLVEVLDLRVCVADDFVELVVEGRVFFCQGLGEVFLVDAAQE